MWKDFVVVIFCVLVLIAVIYLAIDASSHQVKPITSNQINTMALNLTSSVFTNNGNIPAKYTCDADNIIPPLEIQGADPNARSLVLIMDDPDAASVVGHTFDHWVKFNIDPKTRRIDEGKEPLGTSGKNGAGAMTYTGPCPPNGEHHYHFKLYSLDTELALAEGATKAEVEAAMQGHILQEAELVGLYNRSK